MLTETNDQILDYQERKSRRSCSQVFQRIAVFAQIQKVKKENTYDRAKNNCLDLQLNMKQKFTMLF